MAWLPVFAALGLACSSRAAPPSHAPSPPSREAKEVAVAGAPMGCARVGPLECAVPPAPADQLCVNAAPCIVNRPDEAIGPVQELQCEPPSQWQMAPESSGVRAAGIVNAPGVIEEGRVSVAGYLVAESSDGLCLVDEMLPWAWPVGRYFTTDYALHWQTGTAEATLSVQAHRTTFIELDQSEASAGESNVEGEECNHNVYRVVAGRFERLSEERREGACSEQSSN